MQETMEAEQPRLNLHHTLPKRALTAGETGLLVVLMNDECQMELLAFYAVMSLGVGIIHQEYRAIQYHPGARAILVGRPGWDTTFVGRRWSLELLVLMAALSCFEL